MIQLIVIISVLLAFSLYHCNKLYPFDVKTTLPLRGLLAILIVAHHVSQRYTPQEFEIINQCHLFLRGVGGPVVTVFFFITGYGLAKSISNKGDSYLNGFLKKRLSGTVPELLLSSIIMILILMVFKDYTVKQFVFKMMQGMPPIEQSWFMYIIIAIYISFYISYRIHTSHKVNKGILFSFFVIACIFIPFYLNWGKWWYNSTLSVCIGYWLSLNEKKIEPIIRHPLTPLSIICIWGASLFFKDPLGYMITNNLSAVAIYVCIRRYGFLHSNILNFLGNISLNIYLIHPIVIVLFQSRTSVYGNMAMIMIVSFTIFFAYIFTFCLKFLKSLIKTRGILPFAR